MNTKKVLAIIAVIAVGGLIIFFSLRFVILSGGSQPGETSPNLSSGNTKSSEPAFPQSDFLSIGTSRGAVTVKNFYKRTLGFDEQFVVFEKTQGYELNYDSYTSGFSVYISAAPFAANRLTAEKSFLDALGISREDACKLKVFESVSPDVDKKLAGRNLGLSFCGGGL